MLAGLLGIGLYYGIKYYSSRNSSDYAIEVIGYIEFAVEIFNATLMLFYFLFTNTPLGFVCEILQFINIPFNVAKLVDYI